MKLGRRKFFGLAGAAAIGGRKVATDVLADIQQLPTPGFGLAQSAINAVGMPSGLADYTAQLRGQVAKMTALKALGIPPVFREIIREWAGQQQTNLDDINALVSISVSAKKRLIREKMEEQMLMDAFDGPARQLKRHLVHQEFGISL